MPLANTTTAQLCEQQMLARFKIKVRVTRQLAFTHMQQAASRWLATDLVAGSRRRRLFLLLLLLLLLLGGCRLRGIEAAHQLAELRLAQGGGLGLRGVARPHHARAEDPVPAHRRRRGGGGGGGGAGARGGGGGGGGGVLWARPPGPARVF
eukprot:COSAG01_NODE_13882_length_1522_cov_11.381588_1_plen_150_part_10